MLYEHFCYILEFFFLVRLVHSFSAGWHNNHNYFFIQGYDLAIKNTSGLPIKTNDAKKLFGNIKDIYAFNR